MEKAMITVLGNDQVGIIAKICNMLADTNINILDISQTIVGGYFNMAMLVDLSAASAEYEEVSKKLEAIGADMNLTIRIQHTKIFDAMHRI